MATSKACLFEELEAQRVKNGLAAVAARVAPWNVEL